MNTPKTIDKPELAAERSRIALEPTERSSGTMSLPDGLDRCAAVYAPAVGPLEVGPAGTPQTRQLATKPDPAAKPKTDPFEDLLVKLADLVLGEEELHTDWFNMVKLARLSRTHKLDLGFGKLGCKDMDYHCRLYFDQRWDIRRDGVKITWRTEDMEHGTEFQVRFHRLDPANDFLPTSCYSNEQCRHQI